MTVPPEVLELLASWRGVPALVRDEHLMVLASNPLARAVSAVFNPGVNIARYTFLNEWSEEATDDWSNVSAQVVAILLSEVEARPGDEAFRGLVGELAVSSEQFATLWAERGARTRAIGTVTFEHPAVGPLRLTYQTLGIPTAPALSLVIWTAAAGEPQAALDRLIELTEREC